ncbi:MAG: TylF/MycF/NovP-related O-methyltransferase [Rhodothermales bacterium]
MDKSSLRSLYLELVKKSLLGLIHEDIPLATFDSFDVGGADFAPTAYRPDLRRAGQDWPSRAFSMIGLRRMDHLHECVREVIDGRVPGDLIETGAWRGGACIFMRAVLKAYGITDRTVWVADSFEGFPQPDVEHYPADEGLDLTPFRPIMGVSADEVRRNFERYGLLDAQVRLLEGWFANTLSTAPIERLAILRLDGDLYESTYQALEALYSKLSRGGICIVDDYHLEACSAAVEDYRRRRGVDEEIVSIDGHGVFWRRADEGPAF